MGGGSCRADCRGVGGAGCRPVSVGRCIGRRMPGRVTGGMRSPAVEGVAADLAEGPSGRGSGGRCGPAGSAATRPCDAGFGGGAGCLRGRLGSGLSSAGDAIGRGCRCGERGRGSLCRGTAGLDRWPGAASGGGSVGVRPVCLRTRSETLSPPESSIERRRRLGGSSSGGRGLGCGANPGCVNPGGRTALRGGSSGTRSPSVSRCCPLVRVPPRRQTSVCHQSRSILRMDHCRDDPQGPFTDVPQRSRRPNG